MELFPGDSMKGKQLVVLVLFLVALPAVWTRPGAVSQISLAVPAELYLGNQGALLADSAAADESAFEYAMVGHEVEKNSAALVAALVVSASSDSLLTPPEKGGVGVPWSCYKSSQRFVSGCDRKEGIAVSATTLAGVLARSLCNA